jgi:mono/diheme cytochrome c family protein
LDVGFDSHGRSGEINKTVRVRTNDPRTPTSVLRVVGLVAPAVHPPRGANDKIFVGSCRACHVDRGVGKKGEALYAAVCASCHESGRRGGGVRAPDVKALSLLDGKTLGKSIAEGDHGAGIDGFYDTRGGPLSKAQIKSLIRYLRNLKETP